MNTTIVDSIAVVFFTGLSNYGSTMGLGNLHIHSLNKSGSIHEFSFVQLDHLDSHLDIQISRRFWEGELTLIF